MIEIAEVGMVTSVGRDATTTFTSVLAGITRPKPLPYFTVVEPESGDSVPVVGHPIEAFTEGFHLYGLWIRATLASLRDLIARADLPAPGNAAAWARTALVAVLPDIRSERFLSDGTEQDSDVREPFLARIAAWLGVPQTPAQLHVCCSGRAGVFAALRYGAELLRTHAVDRVIVLAVDSQLDTLTLDWLAAEDRLKSVAAAVGLMPGEASVALLLQSSKPNGRAPGGVTVRALADRRPAVGDRTSEARGRLLREVLSACVPALGDANGQGCLWINDQNGEQWRAEEAGYCALFMAEQWPARAQVMVPALSVGDTGAASGALGLGLAALALRDELVAAHQCLVSSSSYRGPLGAVLLETQRG
jgi:3-oxoacyl-[acyl-carrier-protein] synthase-1